MTGTSNEDNTPPDRLYFDPEAVNEIIVEYRRTLRGHNSTKELERRLRKETLEQTWHITHDWAWLPDLDDEEVIRRFARVSEVDDRLERARLDRELNDRGYDTITMRSASGEWVIKMIESHGVGFFKYDE